MLGFTDYLHEVFDAAASLTWMATGGTVTGTKTPIQHQVIATFRLDDVRYRITFHAFSVESLHDGFTPGDIVAEVVFGWDEKSPFKKYKLEPVQRYTVVNVGLKHEFRVFATVRAAIATFIARYKPAVVFFTAEDDEPSRVRLYDTFMRVGGNTFSGYHTQKTRYHYEIRRNDVPKFATI